MQELGREWGAELADGDVLALCGSLGAGKTHLTIGLIDGLGSEADVTSPTFALVQEYLDGRLPAYHFDFYRMESAEELLAIGWDDYLDREGVVIAEWADRFPELMPPGTRWIRIEGAGTPERRVRDGEP